MLEALAELGREELLAKDSVELQAQSVGAIRANTDERVLDFGRSQEHFVRMSGHQTTKFPVIARKYTLDSNPAWLIERKHTGPEEIDGVRRTRRAANPREGQVANDVHGDFNIHLPQSRYFPKSFNRTDEK